MYGNTLSIIMGYRMRLILIFILLSFTLLMIRNANISSMKGKSRSHKYYIFTLVLKLFLMLWVVYKAGNVCIEAAGIYEINRCNIEITNDIKDYYWFPIIRGADNIDENNQLDYNGRLDKFYEAVIDEFSALIIDTGNYIQPGGTMAEKYGQLTVTVNENYLKLNPVHDIWKYNR